MFQVLSSKYYERLTIGSKVGGGQVAQQLRARAVLSEDPSLFPSPTLGSSHIYQHSSREADALSWPL